MEERISDGSEGLGEPPLTFSLFDQMKVFFKIEETLSEFLSVGIAQTNPK